MDLLMPDEDLAALGETSLPALLTATAVAIGAKTLKAAIDGPPEFRLEPGSLQGRTVVITGGSAGLGFEAAVRLAEAGARVVATARSQDKATATEAALRYESGSIDVHVMQLDLANLSSIRTFASELQQQPWMKKGIDVLLNNAGVMAVPERLLTVDGFELQLGVNHLGHFALTGLLMPMMGLAESARVISVSSLAHRAGDADSMLDELAGAASVNPLATPGYSPWSVYSNSKLANVVFAKELDRRLRAVGAKASAVSLHPGLCATELARYAVSGKDQSLETTYASYPAPVQGFMQALKGLMRPVCRGANCHVFLAAGADGGLETSGGEYFEDMRTAQTHPRAGDEFLGAKFWEASEALTGITFDFQPFEAKQKP